VRLECCRPALREPVTSSRPADPDLWRFPAAVRRFRTRARPLLLQGDTPCREAFGLAPARTHNERWWRRHGHPCGKACEPTGTHFAPGPARGAPCGPRALSRSPFRRENGAWACSGPNPSGDCWHPRTRERLHKWRLCVHRAQPTCAVLCAACVECFSVSPRGLYVPCSLLAAAMADGHRPRVWKVLLLQRADQPDAVGVS
jgi:hypothetical protein